MTGHESSYLKRTFCNPAHDWLSYMDALKPSANRDTFHNYYSTLSTKLIELIIKKIEFKIPMRKLRSQNLLGLQVFKLNRCAVQ